MLPSADLSLISTAQRGRSKPSSVQESGTDSSFQEAMRQANASAEPRKSRPRSDDQQQELDKAHKSERAASDNTAENDEKVARDSKNTADTKDTKSDSNSSDSSPRQARSTSEQPTSEQSAAEHSASKKSTNKEEVAESGNNPEGGVEKRSANLLTEASSLQAESNSQAGIAETVITTQQLSAAEKTDGKDVQGGRPENAIKEADLASLAGVANANMSDSSGNPLVEGEAIKADVPKVIKGEPSEAISEITITSEGEKSDDVNLDATIAAGLVQEKLVTGEKLSAEALAAEGKSALAVDGSKSFSDETLKASADSSLQSSGQETDSAKDLTAQLASAALGLSDSAKNASNIPSNEKKVVAGTDTSELKVNESGVAEEPVELDWILQQMGGVDAKLSESPVALAKNDAITTKAGLTPAIALAMNGADSNKGASLQPLDASNGGNITDFSALTDAMSFDVELSDSELGQSNREQLMSNRTMGVDVSTAGGFSSALSAITDAKSIAQPLANGVSGTGTNLTMQVPPSHPSWGAEMADKLTWITQQGVHRAEIHLDPPELGSLTVKVAIDADNATVSFVVASSQVKDLLDGQVQRLREMLAQQNINLDSVDVDVSRQGTGSNRNEAGEPQRMALNGDLEDQDAAIEESDLPLNTASVSPSRVDFYA